MTDLPKRVVSVRKGGLAYRLMTMTLATTTDRDRATRSHWRWLADDNGTTYRLRPVGMMPFTLRVRDHG